MEGNSMLAPFFREAGAGPGVICTHANGSSSGQWRQLTERLAPSQHVFAVDAYDAGQSPPWRSDRPLVLADEVALLSSVRERAGPRAAWVGHSYGAAVALMAALQQPSRVRALALYEPTLFALVDAESPPPNDADGIRHAVVDAGKALDAGDGDAAAERFIDYWSEPGTWAQTPPSRKPSIVAAMAHVRRWGHALFTEPTPLQAFHSLDVPVLYMTGKRSTPAAHAVARLLIATLPQVEHIEFDDLGHMGPVTHPDVVNDTIMGFLARTI
jgi:pimeloyl-ACP methyl ester carboxylesterase